MDLLDLMVKIGADDQASSKVDSLAGKITGTLGKAASVAAKGVAAGVAAVTAATGAITKSSLDAYGAYEQNVGGIQKLFGNMGKSLDEYAELTGNAVDAVAEKWGVLEQSQNMVLQNAANAYKNAGMSANQYMEQVTGFSAALITSLGNDTVAAANYAEMAMVDMSDNANTFGTDMESIQWAYQGFAKQNYTMLDNLKLGYGGTKEEMERLISDANKVKEANGEMAELSIDSFADVVEAIHIMQGEMQIGGTTAREAATTIEGSVNMMKAAWENWLTGLGDSDADMAQLTDNLVESFETAAENVVPRVAIILGTLLGSVPGIVAEVGPVAAQALQDTFMTAAQTFHDMLPQEAQSALDGAIETFKSSGLADAVGNALSGIAEFGAKAADGISQLAESFDETSAMEAAATAIDTVAGFIGHLADQAGEYLMPVLEAAGEALSAFFQAVADAQVWLEPLATFLGDVLVAALEIVAAAFTFAVDTVTLLVNAVTEFVNFLLEAPANIQSFVDQVGAFFGQLPGLVGGFLASVISAIGSWVAQTVSQGIQAGSQFIANVGNFFAQLPGNVANFLGQVIGRVGSWVGEMASNAANAASNFGSSLISGLSSIPGRVYSIGSQIIQGIANGISGAAGTVISAITGAVDGAINTAKSLLGIHSPSRVFRDMFGYVMEGAALGIDDNADLPVRSMKSATDAVADAARFSATVDGGANGSGRTFNFYFNGEPSGFGSKVARLMEQLADAVELEMGMGVA